MMEFLQLTRGLLKRETGGFITKKERNETKQTNKTETMRLTFRGRAGRTDRAGRFR